MTGRCDFYQNFTSSQEPTLLRCRKKKFSLSAEKLWTRSIFLIVFSLDLEISLGMCANGAYFRSLLANNNVAAVRALPDHVAITREDQTALNVSEQLAVTLLRAPSRSRQPAQNRNAISSKPSSLEPPWPRWRTCRSIRSSRRQLHP